MNELKTLEKLEQYGMEHDPYENSSWLDNESDNPEYVLIKDLKQEAIKWIKELERNPRTALHNIFGSPFISRYETGRGGGAVKVERCMGIRIHEVAYMYIKLIKHLYNITEEDLK